MEFLLPLMGLSKYCLILGSCTHVPSPIFIVCFLRVETMMVCINIVFIDSVMPFVDSRSVDVW